MKISIIMSTYREFEKGLLQAAVSSIRKQTYANWELIIVGDAAPAEMQIKQYLSKIYDQRIKFINLPVNQGTASPGTIPKIKGIKQATGELLGFLDADNQYFPKHLENCVKAFIDDLELDLVYGDTLVTSTAIGWVGNLFSFTWKKPDWSAKHAKLIMTSNFLDMSEPIFTRQCYQDARGLDTSHQASDWILWKKMIISGHNNFKHLNHLGLIYRTTGLKHQLQFFFLMLIQNSGLSYHSDKLGFMQKNIAQRFSKKHY